MPGAAPFARVHKSSVLCRARPRAPFVAYCDLLRASTGGDGIETESEALARKQKKSDDDVSAGANRLGSDSDSSHGEIDEGVNESPEDLGRRTFVRTCLRVEEHEMLVCAVAAVGAVPALARVVPGASGSAPPPIMAAAAASAAAAAMFERVRAQDTPAPVFEPTTGRVSLFVDIAHRMNQHVRLRGVRVELAKNDVVAPGAEPAMLPASLRREGELFFQAIAKALLDGSLFRARSGASEAAKRSAETVAAILAPVRVAKPSVVGMHNVGALVRVLQGTEVTSAKELVSSRSRDAVRDAWQKCLAPQQRATFGKVWDQIAGANTGASRGRSK